MVFKIQLRPRILQVFCSFKFMDILASIVLFSPNIVEIFYNSNTVLVFIFPVISQVLHLHSNLLVCFNEYKPLQFFCLSLTNNPEYVSLILLQFLQINMYSSRKLKRRCFKKHVFPKKHLRLICSLIHHWLYVIFWGSEEFYKKLFINSW